MLPNIVLVNRTRRGKRPAQHKVSARRSANSNLLAGDNVARPVLGCAVIQALNFLMAYPPWCSLDDSFAVALSCQSTRARWNCHDHQGHRLGRQHSDVGNSAPPACFRCKKEPT